VHRETIARTGKEDESMHSGLIIGHGKVIVGCVLVTWNPNSAVRNLEDNYDQQRHGSC
jgi:hypothetical protein